MAVVPLATVDELTTLVTNFILGDPSTLLEDPEFKKRVAEKVVSFGKTVKELACKGAVCTVYDVECEEDVEALREISKVYTVHTGGMAITSKQPKGGTEFTMWINNPEHQYLTMEKGPKDSYHVSWHKPLMFGMWR